MRGDAVTVTPDQYRYAAAHLRAAIDHVRLALHYAGTEDAAMDELNLVTADMLVAQHHHCLRESGQPVPPMPPAPGMSPPGSPT